MSILDTVLRITCPGYNIAKTAMEHPETAKKIAKGVAKATCPAYGAVSLAKEHPEVAKRVGLAAISPLFAVMHAIG